MGQPPGAPHVVKDCGWSEEAASIGAPQDRKSAIIGANDSDFP